MPQFIEDSVGFEVILFKNSSPLNDDNSPLSDDSSPSNELLDKVRKSQRTTVALMRKVLLELCKTEKTLDELSKDLNPGK